MPTYDYACDKCGHTAEVFQTFSETPLSKCPECRSKRFRRLIGAGAAVIFKGSGFYGTDYRSEAYKSAEKKDTAPAASTSDKKSCDGPCATPAPAAPASEKKSKKKDG